jgi:hypothetical protein
MRENLIDELLKRKMCGNLSVDKALQNLSLKDEKIWMKEMFSGEEKTVHIEKRKKVVHGYDIKRFAEGYFYLKNHKNYYSFPLSDDDKKKREEEQRLEKEERDDFYNLTLDEQIKFMDENNGSIVKKVGETEEFLRNYLKTMMEKEVRNFLEYILENKEILSKIQIVRDGSYFENKFLIKFDEVLLTGCTKITGIKYEDSNMEKLNKMAETIDVITLNLGERANVYNWKY